MAPRPLLAALLVVAFATCHAGKAHTHRPHRRLKKGASHRPPLSGPDLTKPEEGALEEFGTISNEPTKPKKIAPTPTYTPPPLPAPPPPPPTPTPNMEAAKRWADDVAQYGVCLRDFPTLVTSDTCTSAPLGDADYFLHMLKQEQFALTAGYKTGMARQGLVIDGLGLDATSDDATPLIRHATQRARVQLAYECAPPESECRSSMVPIQDIDSSVGSDPQCPMRVLQADPTAQSKPRAIEIWMGHPNHHQMVAMRGRASEIARAYSANPATMFWADSPSYAAAVAVCYQVRLHGKDGQATPPGMLLKENIYAMPTTDQALPSLEEEDAGEINFNIVMVDAERSTKPEVDYTTQTEGEGGSLSILHDNAANKDALKAIAQMAVQRDYHDATVTSISNPYHLATNGDVPTVRLTADVTGSQTKTSTTQTTTQVKSVDSADQLLIRPVPPTNDLRGKEGEKRVYVDPTDQSGEKDWVGTFEDFRDKFATDPTVGELDTWRVWAENPTNEWNEAPSNEDYLQQKSRRVETINKPEGDSESPLKTGPTNTNRESIVEL